MIKALVLKNNQKKLLLILSPLVLLLLVFYVFQINNLISKSYTLQSYQKDVLKISSENEKIEFNLAGAGSLQNIEEKASELSFEKIDSIYYIQILDSVVAAK